MGEKGKGQVFIFYVAGNRTVRDDACLTDPLVYLAVILDLFSRRTIGYAISRNKDIALSLEALQVGINNRNPPKEVIHHSDYGCSMLPMTA